MTCYHRTIPRLNSMPLPTMALTPNTSGYVMKDKGSSKYSVGGYAALFDADERVYGGAGENLEGLTGYGSTQTYSEKTDTYQLRTNYQGQRQYSPQQQYEGIEQHIRPIPEPKGIASILNASPVVYICVPSIKIVAETQGFAQNYPNTELEELEEFYRKQQELQRKIGKQKWTMTNSLQGQKD